MVEHIFFNGRKYFKTSKGYWQSTDCAGKSLHIEVWKAANGEIPKGCEIHHIDFNPSNNALENLQCLTVSEHRSLHCKLRNQKPKSYDIVVACAQCGKEFMASRSDAKFCSAACHSKWARAHGKCNETRKCACCGKVFLTKPERRTQYCSKICAAIAHKKNKLTLEQREEIKRLYVKGSTEFGARALAKRFNVTHSAILYIVNGK